MKRIQTFLVPLLSLALLASCGGDKRPETVKFFVVEGSGKITNAEASFSLDYDPSNHSIDIIDSSLTFKAKGASSPLSITQNKARPNTITMTFSSAIESDVIGTLLFEFDDATAKATGCKDSVSVEIPYQE